MSGASDSICFYCSQLFQLDGGMNRTSDGRPCPICAERLLDALPPLIPAPHRAAEARADEESSERQAVRVRPLRGPRPTTGGSGAQGGGRGPRLVRPADDRPEPA